MEPSPQLEMSPLRHRDRRWPFIYYETRSLDGKSLNGDVVREKRKHVYCHYNSEMGCYNMS